MVAEVAINRFTGSGPTKTRIDSDGGLGITRASTSDSATPGIANPIPIPIPGSVTRSYWVTLRLETISAPAGTIDNVRWYTVASENPWPGVTMEASTATAYTEATGVEGSYGDPLTVGNYPTLTGTPGANNAFAYTSVSPLSVNGSTSTNEEFGDFIVYQITVTPAASQGNLLPILMTIAYDET